MPVVTSPAETERLADATLRYVVACEPVFERLRGTAMQLGGLALIIMLRREGAFDAETPRRMAADTLAAAQAVLATLAVPAAAAHHFHHVDAAAAALEDVVGVMARRPLDRDGEAARREISARLRTATEHLRHAESAMPGFETVDLRHSCCAAHATAVFAAEPTDLRF
jgi:hypothetical protein